SWSSVTRLLYVPTRLIPRITTTKTIAAITPRTIRLVISSSLSHGFLSAAQSYSPLQPRELFLHLLVEAIRLLVKKRDFHFRFDVHFIIDVGPHTILLRLPVLTDQDEYRKKNSFKGNDHCQQPKWIRIELTNPQIK